MCDDGTTQYLPKRLRQPYFNARTTQTRACPACDLRGEENMGACTCLCWDQAHVGAMLFVCMLPVSPPLAICVF